MAAGLKVGYFDEDGGPPWVVSSGEMKVARLETEARAQEVLQKLERLEARLNQRMVLVRQVKALKEEVMKKSGYPPPKPTKIPKKGGSKAPKC